MRRRDVLAGLLLTATMSTVRAQQAKVPKVGFLYPGPRTAAPARIDAFLEGLRTAGYAVPEQVELLTRIADGDPQRISPLVAELVDRPVDVIVAVSTAAAKAAQAATTTIPIVAHDLETDPIASGLVAGLAHPGGNITGFFFDFPDFRMKWLELLKETIPHASRIAVLWDPATGPWQLNAVEAAAGLLKLDLQILEIRTPAQLEDAIAVASRRGADALLMLSSPIFGANAKLAADLALNHRLPAVTLFPDFARNGGLMAYGPNLLETYRRLGAMVGKVLQGKKPAELPVERPSRFELIVNLGTAKALNVSIPSSVLVRADEVIE